MEFEFLQQYLNETADSFLTDNQPVLYRNKVVIKDLIALPIICSYSFDRNSLVEIKYPQGRIIGAIKFLKDFHIDDYNGLNDENKICFFTDYDKEQIVNSSYTFKYDYLLLKKQNYATYIKEYMETSSVWGSYIHVENIPSISFNEKLRVNKIKVENEIKSLTGIYADNIYLSIIEPNPFIRFLKLYHMIELQFDMHTAIKINELLILGNKEKDISVRLKDYAKEEISRLNSIIKDRCLDIDSLIEKINLISSHKSNALTIFYEYGKENSNPIKRKDFEKLINIEGKFNEANIKANGGAYPSLILKLTGYWIYRVRCCIAHNKLGEYIMGAEDEKFLVNFAEPLMKEVIRQCFNK